MGLLFYFVAVLFRLKWAWLIAGAALLGYGAFVYFSAQPVHPLETDGTIGSYDELTLNGSYDHNELVLAGEPTVYSLNKDGFHPTMPDMVWIGDTVRLWTDSGSTDVIAIVLYDEQDQNPIKYTTPHYDNPPSEKSDMQVGGITLGGVGLACLGVFGLWFGRGRLARRPSAPAMAAGTSMAVGLSPDGKYHWDGTRWQEVAPAEHESEESEETDEPEEVPPPEH